MEGEEINIDLTSTNLAPLYRHAFTQINNSATIITNSTESSSDISGQTIVTATAESGSVLLQCTAMSIQQLKSNMYGFGINAKSAQKVVEVFKTPRVIVVMHNKRAIARKRALRSLILRR